MKPSLAEATRLEGISPDVLGALDAVAEWFSVPAGWPLLSAGEPPDGVYFLVSGSLGKLGGQLQIVLSLIDVNHASVGRRVAQLQRPIPPRGAAVRIKTPPKRSHPRTTPSCPVRRGSTLSRPTPEPSGLR